MKVKLVSIKNLILLSILFVFGFSDIQAQTALKKAMDRINVSINMPSCFKVSQNEEVMSIIETKEDEILPTIAQSYGIEPAYGNTFFLAMFGLVHSIVESEKSDYLFFVNVSPGKGGGFYGNAPDNPEKLNVFNNISLGGIKRHFQWGNPMVDASEAEANELYPLLKVYSKELAKTMFNANVIVSYPVNLRGNIYKNKYTRCRAVVVGKDRLEFEIIFMMTDESVKNFDEHMKDINNIFWFNERETSKKSVSSKSKLYDFEVGGIYYKLMNNNNVEVAPSPNRYSGIVSIPDHVSFNDTIYSVTSIGGGAFIGCSGLTSVVLPQSITRIKSYAFMLCNSLESIIIPNSVTQIEESVFSGCRNLKSIAIPNSVTKIKEFAFWECLHLDSITIPNSVTSIGAYAFYRCRGLKSVIIPNSVEEIMEDAFGQCDTLTSVTCYILKPFQIKNPVFSGVKFENCILYVPKNKKELYKTTEGWNSFLMIKEI